MDGNSIGRSSTLTEDKKLKRNASENINLHNQRGVSDLVMIVGGEKIREKNSQVYLETIRENGQIQMKSRARPHQIKYNESDDSYESKHNGKAQHLDA